MPCNGHNNPPSCNCGWGGMWHGSQPVPVNRIWADGKTRLNADGSLAEASSIHRHVVRRKPESITIPNARCPVCCASVFFYQNEYGSRVFFDDLGYGWPKHPCTDDSRYDSPISGKIFAPASPREHRLSGVAIGWGPFLIYEKREFHIVVADFLSDEYLRLELKSDILSNVFPVVFIKIISDGRLTLSYYHSGVRSEIKRDVTFAKVNIPADARPVHQHISLREDIDNRRLENRAAMTGEYGYSTMPYRLRSATRELPNLTSPEHAIGDVIWLDDDRCALVVRTTPIVMRTLTWDALDQLGPWQRHVRCDRFNGERIVLPPDYW
jgi:hypothetical protein